MKTTRFPDPSSPHHAAELSGVIIRKFKPQFWDSIRKGIKTSTIRPRSALKGSLGKLAPPPVPGMLLELQGWSGAPYRSKMIRVGYAILKEVKPVRILPGRFGTEVHIWTSFENTEAPSITFMVDADPSALELLRVEGFELMGDFLRWFDPSLVFNGMQLIWSDFLPYEGP